MSNQTQSITLQTAIMLQVREFAALGQSFSVHDVTTEVRNKVNNGVLEIPEVEVAGASIRFNIEHVKVKALFDELWRTKAFEPDFSVNRNFNGRFFEYTPSAVSVAVSLPVSAPVSTVGASVAPSTVAQMGDTSVKARVETYLENCAAKNFRPTLKQVQSAIKRTESTGWSCEDLRTLIESDLGYTVVNDPDALSASQVAVN